jgi:uncharacterized RDD family membrane protein YckC
MLDSVLAIETPEGVALSLRLAGPVPRFMAYGMDLLIRMAVLIGVQIVLSVLGTAGFGLFAIIAFLVEWFYPVFFEVFFDGATPGKRSIGLAVVEVSGLPVSMRASVLRNLLRIADFLPLAFGAGLLSMICTQHFQRLGDLAAGTVVVWRKNIDRHGELPDAPAVPPRMRLSLEEQKELVVLAERLGRLTPERQLELADLAEPLTGRRGQAGLQSLFGMANFIAGKR